MSNKKEKKILKDWFFPKLWISVKAENIEEAEKTLNKANKLENKKI